MKKYVFVVFAIIACLALTGCKSQAVRTAEKQINSIGDVTIESGPAISEAEKSYAALSSDEQGTVSNYQTLTDARDTYQSIALDSFQSAIEAGNYDEGNQIVSKLDDMGASLLLLHLLDELIEAAAFQPCQLHCLSCGQFSALPRGIDCFPIFGPLQRGPSKMFSL